MKSTRKRLIYLAAEVVFILCLHALLKRWMASSHVAATLLSAGPHTPRLVLAGAGLFAALRLFTVLLLPGLVVASIGGIIYDHCRRKREQPADAAPPSDPNASEGQPA